MIYLWDDPVPAEWCEACRSYGHAVDECPDSPHKPPPAGRADARVTVSRRPSYLIKIGKRNRRFPSKTAAYYALAKRMLVIKYMPPLAAAGYSTKRKATADEVAAETGLDVDVVKTRGERAVEMFISDERFSDGTYGDGYFDGGKWKSYVRRVAKKLRALDEHAERMRNAGGGQ